MENLKEKALEFFNSNANTNTVFATKDGTLFYKEADAKEHARVLDPENAAVETFERKAETTAEKTTEKAKTEGKTTDKKLTVAELKAIKEAAVKEYTEVFGVAPDDKLSGAKIQELVDAKKAELANVNGDGDAPGENKTVEE